MNRFPQHFHERVEQPMRCFACENPLTELESDHYWERFPLGQSEPYCFDCASQIDLTEVKQRQESWHICSMILFGGAIGFLALATYDRTFGGYFLMGAVFCGSLGLLARICRW